jgi:hypothetical protein
MKASILIALPIVLVAVTANAQDSTQENQPFAIPPLTQQAPYDPLKQPRWDDRSSTNVGPPPSFYDPSNAPGQSLPPVRYFDTPAPSLGPGASDDNN